MSASKSERLMNLVIALLVSRHYLTRDRIRQVVEGYRDQSDEAFERMFERDKEELREIGIDIEVGHLDKLFEDEPGYLIRRDQVELPEIVFDATEAAVVGLAARVWQHARLARDTSNALVKLKAAGITVEPEALSIVEPQLAADEPAFEPLWEALRTRTPVTFEYARVGRPMETRRLEPWGLTAWHGRWYVVGHDQDRGEPRMFRLSRIAGGVSALGRTGSYTIPEGTDVRALAGELQPSAPTGTATLRIRADAGHGLRRRATRTRADDEGWDVVSVPYAGVGVMAEEVCGYAADVVVLGPPDLREAVIRRLDDLVGGSAA